jgi:diguanylate cyclase (GGDEF)-like protein/PAS domain S-box-containing protein
MRRAGPGAGLDRRGSAADGRGEYVRPGRRDPVAGDIPEDLVRAWLRKLWRITFPAIETLISIPIVVVIHALHLDGRTPLWFMLLGMLALAATQHRDVQLALAGGDLSRRLWLRTGLHLGVLTAVLYMFGWGPAFTVSYAVGGLMHLRWSGASAWRPVAVWALVGTAAGQLGISLGLVYTHLSPAASHVVAWTGSLLAVFFVRQYALAVQERERVRQEAEQHDRRFAALVQNSSDITIVCGPEGLITYISPAVERLLGYRPADLLGTRGDPYLAPGELERLAEVAAPLWARPAASLRVELELRHRDGSARWYDAVLLNLLHDPAVRGIVINQRDVTEQRAAAHRLAYDASHDLLTGLDNRRAFLSTLEQAIERSRVTARSLAVLYIDLDGFKQINDRLGHEVGDGVLRGVAEQLRRSVLGGDVIGRLGGDEFAAVLRDVGSTEQAEAVVRRILRTFGEPLEVGGHLLRVAASVGIAIAGEEELTGEQLLHQADLAMYAAKRRRIGGWVVHTAELEAEAARSISAQELTAAVQQGQLRLQYQPVCDLGTGRLVGVEALVRWHHPERGLIAPDLFIPAAEDNGAIIEVGEWVARQACEQLARWQPLSPAGPRLTMSINVSPRQLELPSTAGRLAEIFATAGVAPADVLIEVTESALVASPVARQTLDDIAALGSAIAIDDFGTGYSSLQYLNQLPIDTLKLDRSFVAQLDGSPLGSAVAAAVASLAGTFGLRTVAEGIETREQLEELRALGYGLAQGYLFARPMNPADLEPLIRAGAVHPGPEAQSGLRTISAGRSTKAA